MTAYWQNFSAHWVAPFTGGASGILGALVFILLLVWSLVWKGLALWRAARQGKNRWFIALLAINTFGILEILFLFVFSKKAQATGSVDPTDVADL